MFLINYFCLFVCLFVLQFYIIDDFVLHSTPYDPAAAAKGMNGKQWLLVLSLMSVVMADESSPVSTPCYTGRGRAMLDMVLSSLLLLSLGDNLLFCLPPPVTSFHPSQFFFVAIAAYCSQVAGQKAAVLQGGIEKFLEYLFGGLQLF